MSMESDNHNHPFNTSLLEQDINLSRFHRYNKLSLIFKFFFISLTLIIAALFIYLVQDIASDSDSDSDSDHSISSFNPANQTSDPITSTKSQIFLQTAAKGLEDVASSILFNYLGSNNDIATDFALNSCWRSLTNGSARIRDALEVNPFPDDDEQGVEIMNLLVVKAEENIRSCLDDLETVESTAATEVRAKALRAKVYLSGRGDFLMSYEYMWQKLWSTIAAAWTMVLENVFTVCLCGMQLLFISYLLWTLFKFR